MTSVSSALDTMFLGLVLQPNNIKWKDNPKEGDPVLPELSKSEPFFLSQGKEI